MPTESHERFALEGALFMNTEEANRIIKAQLKSLEGRPYSELADMVQEKRKTKAETGRDGKQYPIEVEVLWNSKPQGDIFVSASIRHGTHRPLTDHFIKGPGDPYYEIQTIERWEELIEREEKFTPKNDENEEWRPWAFRGHRRRCWLPASSLERYLKKYKIPFKDAPMYEKHVVREFDRHLHLYEAEVWRQGGVERLALMRHFGGPTRLIDWTYSFWVAVFFAIEGAREQDVCSVWAMDTKWCREQAEKLMSPLLRWRIKKNSKDPGVIRRIFKSDAKFVWPLNPFWINERLALQQGVFVAARDVTASFMKNWEQMAVPEESRKNLFRLDIQHDPEFLRKTVRKLHRMNINRATLFPGLAGLAKDLHNRFLMRDLVERTQDEPFDIWDVGRH